jgi:hypothetical protein
MIPGPGALVTAHSRIAAFLLTPLVMVWSGAAADTLRCRSKLVETGATASEVLASCGAPDSKEFRTEPVHARTAAGGTRIIGTAQKEIWRYERGRGQFPAILTFEEGVLKKLEFEKS